MKQLVLIFMLCLTPTLYAKEISVFGETYPILEEDFLQFIQKRLKTMQKNGEWKKIQSQMQKRAISHADRPKALEKITKATVQKEWVVDPSMTLSNDLKDQEGRVFAKAGTTFNPLSMVSLKNALLFIDADDEKQVEWAKRKNREFGQHTKIILVKGSISSTEKIFHQRIYFDQQGQLTQHFHIEHVPTLITQERLFLKVIEEAL